MKIKCVKSGGFMGNQLTCTIEFDELDPVEQIKGHRSGYGTDKGIDNVHVQQTSEWRS